MYGIVGKLNTSSVIDFELVTSPSILVKENPIKKGSQWSQFGWFSKVDEVFITSGSVNFYDLVNTISIQFEENRSFVKSKIYVKLPNPSIYNVSEFFVEGYFKYLNVKSHTDGKKISGKQIIDLIEDNKIVTFANRVFIKKMDEAKIQSSSVETEFGKLTRFKKHMEIDI